MKYMIKKICKLFNRRKALKPSDLVLQLKAAKS